MKLIEDGSHEKYLPSIMEWHKFKSCQSHKKPYAFKISSVQDLTLTLVKPTPNQNNTNMSQSTHFLEF